MKIAICASIKAYSKVIKIKTELEKRRIQVFCPWTIEEIQQERLHPKEIDKFKLQNKSKAIKIHYEKIKKSDAILIANETKNKITHYLGGNTLMEMGFAYILNKKIYLLNPIPKMIYTEEIKAMKPIILFGDLNKISFL